MIHFYIIILILFLNPLKQVLCESLIEHTRPSDGRPTEPIRIFSLRLPFKTGPIEESHSFTFNYHLGNTWNPTVAIKYAGTPERYKVYGADGVIRSGNVRYINKVTPSIELEFALNSFMLTKGNLAVDYFASDHFIEQFHGTLLSEKNPFDRLQNGLDNVAQIHFQDLNGESFDINNNQIFFGTFDIGSVKYFNLINSNDRLVTLNLGIFVGFPLNKFNSHMSAGLQAGIAHTVQLFEKNSMTTALQFTGQHDHLIKFQKGSNYVDRNLAGGYRLLWSYNYKTEGNSYLAVGFEFQGMTSPLSDKSQVVGPIRPEDIGIPTQYTSSTGLRRSYSGQLTGSEYISLFFQFRPSCYGKATTYDFYIQEDWKVLSLKKEQWRSLSSNPLLFFHSSDNLQDFGIGFRMEQAL